MSNSHPYRMDNLNRSFEVGCVYRSLPISDDASMVCNYPDGKQRIFMSGYINSKTREFEFQVAPDTAFVCVSSYFGHAQRELSLQVYESAVMWFVMLGQDYLGNPYEVVCNNSLLHKTSWIWAS